MRRGLSGALIVMLAVALAWAAGVGAATGESAAGASACTFEQKQVRAAALAAFRSRIRGKRPTAAQRRRLAALRRAAACSVPPLPPSSSSSCSPSLAPNEMYERSRTDGRLPSFLGNEGPTHPGDFLSPRGHVRALVLLVDFPDLADDRAAAPVAPTFFPDTKYFDEVSYGRFSVSVEALGRWVRMPRPSASYVPMGERLLDYAGDAVAAADPVVDFARFQFVFLVPTQKFVAGTTSQALVRYPGRGFVADGVELRFFATLQTDVARLGRGAAYAANHEFLHTLGFPDTRNSPERSGAWDPMGDGTGGPPSTHLLGWHKWKVGWLDPDQLTCLSAPGSVDETITRLAASGGKKLVVVPVNGTTAYVVEARTRLGYDRSICEEGVLVYTVDSRAVAGQFVDGNGVVNLKGPKRCESLVAGAFTSGQTYEDERVKVEVLARDAVAYRVRVTRK